MKRPYPEVRNSHRAGHIERARAEKVRAKAKQQQEASKAMAAAQQQGNVVQHPAAAGNGAGASGGSEGSGQGRLRYKRQGKPLPARDRDVVRDEIARRGVEDVARDVMEISAGHDRDRALYLLRQMERDPEHRFWGTTASVVATLARKYRNELPFPREAASPPSPAPVAPAAEPVHAAALAVPQTPIAFDVATITTIVDAVLDAREKRQQQPHRPQLARPPVPEFSEMSDAEIRDLVAVHHTAIARELERRGVQGAFHAAWRRSYRAFQESTGVDVLSMAEEEAHATGKRTQGIDIVVRLGELRRFWDIVRGAA